MTTCVAPNFTGFWPYLTSPANLGKTESKCSVFEQKCGWDVPAILHPFDNSLESKYRQFPGKLYPFDDR